MFSSFVLALDKDDSSKVVIIKGDKIYYLSPKGELIPSDSSYYNDINDLYTKYYRMVYNDSTLQNPNYIIPNKNEKSIIFIMDINDLIRDNNFGFELSDFIQVDKNAYILKENAIKKIKKK
jgi:hypothetical protein